MYFLTFCDAALPLQGLNFCAAEGMVVFHDYLLLMLIFIGAIIFELLSFNDIYINFFLI